MLGYILRRILYAIPILFGVSLVTFVLFYMTATPEQMARRNLSAKNPTPAQIKEWTIAHGYDKPLSQQFTKHMRELFTFNFGKSDATGELIWDRLRAGVGPSAIVAGLVFVTSIIVQVSLALGIALYRGTKVDAWATFICVLMMSIVYVVYIIAGQYVLGKVMRLAPIAGWSDGLSALRFVFIPVVVAVLAGSGSQVRFYRTLFLEEISQDYVRTARAKGVSERRVLFRHVLRNASIPILTSVVLSIPFLLLGSLLLESFFGIPGLGGLTVDAINSQDFAVVRAMVFLSAVLYIAGAILTDISYAIADPRVRLD